MKTGSLWTALSKLGSWLVSCTKPTKIICISYLRSLSSTSTLCSYKRQEVSRKSSRMLRRPSNPCASNCNSTALLPLGIKFTKSVTFKTSATKTSTLISLGQSQIYSRKKHSSATTEISMSSLTIQTNW